MEDDFRLIDANTTHLAIVSNVMTRLLNFYATSERNESFVKTIYTFSGKTENSKQNLLKFYKKCDNTALRNVIICSNLNHLPRWCDYSYITSKNIFILIFYFDDIEDYATNFNNNKIRKYASRGGKLSSRDKVSEFMSAKFSNNDIADQSDQKMNCFFSDKIGYPQTMARFLNEYNKEKLLNVLDLTNSTLSFKEHKNNITCFINSMIEDEKSI